MITRQCSRCQAERPIEAFAKKSKTQLRSWCKRCDSRRACAFYYVHWAERRDVNNANARRRYRATRATGQPTSGE